MLESDSVLPRCEGERGTKGDKGKEIFVQKAVSLSLQARVKGMEEKREMLTSKL